MGNSLLPGALITQSTSQPSTPWNSWAICHKAFFPSRNDYYTEHIYCQSHYMVSSFGSSKVPSCKKAKLQARIKPTALCSAIDKENSIESPLDFSTLLIQLLHGLYTTFPHLSYDPSCDIMWLWLWHSWCDTFLHSLLCSKFKIKEKKRKENINNDLVVLPSHDTSLSTISLNLRKCYAELSYGSQVLFKYYHWRALKL